MTMDPASLDTRLRQLETAISRQHVVIAVLALLLVGFVVVVPAMRNKVTAETFLLTSDGSDRAAFTTSPNGIPSLAFFDATGKVRLNVSMRSDGSPDITMSDPVGRIRAALRVSEDGIPNLFFTDTVGDIRAALGVPTDGLPTLVLLSQSGRVRYMTP
ncbi:MAG: hypothetical protein PVF27_01400 [Gemmatimonadales bacterium]|jgi:hypothetical protein